MRILLSFIWKWIIISHLIRVPINQAVLFMGFWRFCLLGGSSQLVSVVKNHGDRKSPRLGVVGLLPNGLTSWLVNGGDPNIS